MENYQCTQCKRSFRNYRSDKSKYCSKQCKYDSQIIDKTLVCKYCSKQFMFERSGRSYNRREYCSKRCLSMGMSITKTGTVAWNKGIKYLSIRGSNHWNWQGGKPRNLRLTTIYRDWRKAVFGRDDYTCQLCGTRGGELIADHIKPFAYFPELRLVIDNGRTLCKDCNYEVTYVTKEWRKYGLNT